MKHWFYSIAIGAFILTGCTPETPQTTTSTEPVSSAPVQPVQLTPEQELEKFCRVCVVDKDEKIEEYLPSRLDTSHDGHTYKFCSDVCKKKFDADSAHYAMK